jgi:hypothetical protein
MAAFLDVLFAFPTWLKIGWVVWTAWGAWQLAWYRRERHQAGAFTLPRRFNVIDSRAPEPAGARFAVPEPIGRRFLAPEPIVHRFVTPDPFDEVPPHVADAATTGSVPEGMEAHHTR